MHKIRRRQNKLNSDVQGNQIKIKELNTKIKELETRISDKKLQVAKQLKAMYMLSNLNKFFYILNSKSINDLEKHSKYLKMYSEADYENIVSFSYDIKELSKVKKRLDHSTKTLQIASERLKNQNNKLDKQIKSKKTLLTHLKRQRQKYFQQLSKIKDKREKMVIAGKIDSLDEIFGTNFFDKRGELPLPVIGQRVGKFGVVVDKKYKNKNKNNGIFISSQKNFIVRSVHKGRVNFIGEIRGLGRVILIEHGDNYYTFYGNNSNVFVKIGDQVDKDDQIASVGYSPIYSSYGTYFEIRHYTEPINPKRWFAKTQSLTKL